MALSNTNILFHGSVDHKSDKGLTRLPSRCLQWCTFLKAPRENLFLCSCKSCRIQFCRTEVLISLLAAGHGHAQFLEATCICSFMAFSIFKVSNSGSSPYLALNLSFLFFHWASLTRAGESSSFLGAYLIRLTHSDNLGLPSHLKIHNLNHIHKIPLAT